MVIGIDIDDTITDTMGVLFPYAQKFVIEDLNQNLVIRDLKDSDDIDYVENMLGWDLETDKKFFAKYYEKIMLEVKPYQFAVETINKLKDEGHKIIIITARFDFLGNSNLIEVEKLTRKYLNDIGLKYDELIANVQNKGEVAEKYGLDFFVDDGMRNCLSVESKGVKTYIMDNRCNSRCNNSKVKRVYSWPHFEAELRKEME